MQESTLNDKLGMPSHVSNPSVNAMKTQLNPFLFLARFALASIPVYAETKDSEWTPLFDGKSTKGWTPRAKVESFQAKDGQLHLSSKGNVWVVSDLKMSDYEVEAEVKIPSDYAGFNS